ncbi:Uncharacterised protein [Candidatus Bartonella washoeensis]|uniref:Uncharacterized protein n=1 Tax=Candidatus Bartonella washoeensis Sb944nv TaxID=1094563 RepID=J1J815_9HYPH|nr:hypothetical protein [Bartonella washoeensis]EJF79955.1 hypothetical protein MCQ_00557 [Bartonella washoeensis Sb944nv]SPU26089.1 Uncharacterised protein [Bartonella washoeensis]
MLDMFSVRVQKTTKKVLKKILKTTKGAVSHSFVPISPRGEAATITDAVYDDIYALIF